MKASKLSMYGGKNWRHRNRLEEKAEERLRYRKSGNPWRSSKPPTLHNKYAGICEYCKQRVEAREGFMWMQDSKWKVKHNGCGAEDNLNANK